VVIKLVSMRISMLHWRIESLMLNGAISYAMLCKNPTAKTSDDI
jgi:hypothetical protein